MRKLSFALVLFASPVWAQAQQQPPATVQDMQRIITVLEVQRTNALTNHAIAAARADGLAEEVSKLKAEIDELKKATAAK